MEELVCLSGGLSLDQAGCRVLVELSLKSALVVLAGLVMTLVMRRASAAWRHAVWAFVVAGVAILPACTILLPAWRMPLLPAAA